MKILQINVSPLLKYKRMRLPAVLFLCFIIACNPVQSWPIGAVTADPVLQGLILEQTYTFENAYKARKKLREATLIAQSGITTGLQMIHDVENTTLKYMENAGAVVSNLIQLKNIAEYAIELPGDLYELLELIPDNPKGVAITAVATKKVQQTAADVISLSSLVADVVSTTYSFSDESKNPDKKHVNLLSSAERYTILMDVESRLKKISRDIWILKIYFKSLDWKNLWLGVDRMSYFKAVTAKYEINSIKRKWDKLIK